MQSTKKPPRLKKAQFPRGKSVRVNLKLSEDALKAFYDLKNRKACKLNAEVFDYICDSADQLTKNHQDEQLDAIFNISKFKAPEATTRKIFTLNQYTLSKLRTIAKKTGLSIDEVVNRTLVFTETLIRTFQEQNKIRKKYSDESYVLKEIGDIWSRVSELSYGLEVVFPQEAYSDDPDSLGLWFAHIEGGLQELDELVSKLFNEKFSQYIPK